MKRALFAEHSFQDQVYIVTGAAGGVGGATAQLLSSLGAKLMLSDQNAEQLSVRATELAQNCFPADLRSVQACEELIALTVQRYGKLDGLINCAGIWVEGASETMQESDWQRCIDVNLKACFFLCSRAIPALKKTQGAIVNVSSDAGVVCNAGAAIYCASKGGVSVMSKSLAVELAPFGVRVNAICPSDIRSPMLEFQAQRFGNGDPQAYFRQLLSHYPQGEQARFLEAEEVAHYIVYLLSPMAAGITGATAMLDFGVTAGY